MLQWPSWLQFAMVGANTRLKPGVWRVTTVGEVVLQNNLILSHEGST